MKKNITKQLRRMTFVVLLMLFFAVWQRDFVFTAINSNIFLNATIIGTFVFGLVYAFKNLFGLDNELISIQALQESYNDLLRKEQDEADPYQRFRRCKKPAMVFTPPRIMWQAYHLISDEMARTNDLQMSAGVMQTLMDGIDAKLDDQRSLTSYITGLLVFLGLIGTFVGLMVTLASVGVIIGDLDLSGSAGTESIQKLLENLKVPLQGMATGFSSSLFGLVTSLALGLVARFQNSAASDVKLTFETWLSSVVHITDRAQDGTGETVSQQAAQSFNAQHLRLMFNVAKYSLSASNRTNRIMDSMASAVSGLGEEQKKQVQATGKLALLVDQNSRYQTLMSHNMGRMAEALKSHDEVALKLREIDLAVNSRFDDVTLAVSQAAGNIESLSEEIIRMGQSEENRMDAELERMMTEIEGSLREARGHQVNEILNPVAELRRQLSGEYGGDGDDDENVRTGTDGGE